MTQSNEQICALCSEEVTSHPIIEGMHAFCCAGCYAVFNILSSKQQLEGFEQHPIFLQALRSGLISNPALLDVIQKQRAEVLEGEREKLYLEITEMWCPSCAEIIKLMVLKEKGVTNCVIDYATDLAAIEYSPRYLSREEIISLIKKIGYNPIPLDSAERKAVSSDLYLRFGIAAFCALNSMMFAYPLYATYFSYDGEDYGLLFAWLSFIVSLPVVFYSAWPIWKRFFNSLKTGIYGMETLVFIGVAASFVLSFYEIMRGETKVYFDTMTVIIVFVLLGKIIESKAKFSAKESLMQLTRSIPRRGRKLFADGSLSFVLVKEMKKEDFLVAYAGEKITLDGVVTDGEGACDEALMTGEAIPIVKRKGDSVLGGTILVQGRLTYKVTSCAEESALQKIIEMVERDIGHKSAYVRAADRIVRWFVPFVIMVAFFVAALYWLFPASTDTTPGLTALLRAMAVLLISCPCAIGIAAPTAESHILNGLAAIGAIVRNRGCLPFLGKETVIVFDKTGTVTEGRYIVRSGLDLLESVDQMALFSMASLSMHPVACAIARSLADTQKTNVAKLEEVIGFGLKAEAGGQCYILGSARYLHQMGISIPEVINDQEVEAFSTVYFAKDKNFLACLTLGDRIRPELKSVLMELKSAHSEPLRLILLSGDSEEAVSVVAKNCGFDAWQSGCTPFEKRGYIEKMRQKGGVICMIGDGINDAPALTAANIGISVVSATDMSIQVSDLLLTTDNLNVLTKMRQIACKGHKIIQQNLFWAFFYNVIGIFLAAFGVLSPIFAAFAMSVSSLTVLFNSRRLHK
ncbi:MAG TPA: cation-translocating P-type ATPase [Parachlamydiaceae bacterium]|nr:cation-translocating P-type ATPase [Parachlamydiaceae bacterium]